MSGFEETPTLSVPGTGTIRAELSGNGETISYRLRYLGLTGPALFAHIHLGRPAIAGGVVAFLCDSSDTAPEGVIVLECPGAGGQVTGTIQASDVIGPAGQGIAAGEFDELVAAIRAKATYANVHTDAFPSGELRGRIR